ncbi:MAG TPA: hypothetical protein PLR25_28020 [Planctomycetaceae bacterium]|nr:hypothetical protein [Planctomycetaceae bacterium]
MADLWSQLHLSVFRVKAWSLCSASLLAAACCVVHSQHADAQEFMLKSSPNLHWYRGNMHTHSLWSDGDNYPVRQAQTIPKSLTKSLASTVKKSA